MCYYTYMHIWTYNKFRITMSKFCVDNCNNLLETVTGADTFVYKCNGCGKIYKPTDEDTRIVHHVMYSSETDKHKDLLASVKYDPSTPEVFNDGCNKCGNILVKKIRIHDNLSPTFVCPCGNIWS